MLTEFYTDINDLPLYNWLKLQEGKYEYVNKSLHICKENEQYFNDLYDQYLQKRGLSEQYRRILNCVKKIALLECDYVIKNDRFLLTLIDIEREKYKQLTKVTGKEVSIEKTLIFLSKWIGYRLDPKQITVLEYYNILEEYGKD